MALLIDFLQEFLPVFAALLLSPAIDQNRFFPYNFLLHKLEVKSGQD